MKMAGFRSESGSISQRHRSADPDPDPHQNVMDPQHWLLFATPHEVPFKDMSAICLLIRYTVIHVSCFCQKSCSLSCNYRRSIIVHNVYGTFRTRVV
jgi:hypothetical protein